MSVALYMDVHVPRAVTVGLRMRGVDVTTAQEDGCAELEDDDLLARATELGRVLVSQDSDLLREGVRFQREAIPFSGIVFGHQIRVTIGEKVADLELIAKATTPDEWINRIEYLPLE